MDNYGFLKVAAAVPRVKVGDCAWNASRLAALADEAAQRGVEIVVFPELALTGYTCGDLLLHGSLLDAADEALEELVRATRKLPLTLIAGIPLRHGSTLYIPAAPCIECSKLIIQAGIKRVVYCEEYRSEEGLDLLRKVGIECIQREIDER